MRWLLAALLLAVAPARARTLAVGPGGEFAALPDAARAARAGDTVRIGPGSYGCAVWLADGLTIAGAGIGRTVIEGPLCRGKTLLLAGGHALAVRDLTLRGARSEEGNAAGIWADVPELTIERVRFEADQNGILTAPQPDGYLRVTASEFVDDGACIGACAHGIYAGHIATVDIRASRFFGTRAGHAIKSRARETTVADTVIADGPDGTSSYAIDLPDGGRLSVSGVRITKGVHAGNPAVIAVGEEALTNGATAPVLRDVTVVNEGARPVTLLLNRTGLAPDIAGLHTEGSVQRP